MDESPPTHAQAFIIYLFEELLVQRGGETMVGDPLLYTRKVSPYFFLFLS